ncbi:MAG TPA: type IV secretory system conjugative DNA transfer family protein [Acidimicrobiales bacterium]|nr:type IV secretory system conjugative DNA transfer family protein [Acidimicrobiales bacterium]
MERCLTEGSQSTEASRTDARGRGVYLGRGQDGSDIWSGSQRCALVLGPPRSGKTSSLIIPNVLAARGAVVSTSTKPDVLGATWPERNRKGWTCLFDPSGEVPCPSGVEKVGWSPLATARVWDAALATSTAMVQTAATGPGADHWHERATALLAPLIHAAALAELPMRTVLKWIDRRDGATPLDILSTTVGDDATATDVLSGIVATDVREQSGIWSTASGVLAAYRSENALRSTERAPLDADAFCRGAHTMYICSPGRRQELFAPLVVGVLGDVRDATYVRERDAPGATPTLLALDELANIAPLPDLVPMVSEGGGQGLLLLACLQDLSQARTRWGQAADGFLSLFGTSVMLPGIADPTTLRTLSMLAGEHEVRRSTLSHSLGARGRLQPSTSVSTIRVPRHPVEEIAQGIPGHAFVMGPHRKFGHVSLTPAHSHSPWREFVQAERTVARTGVSLGR